MEIINHLLFKELKQGRALRLDLGCGNKKREGYYGVDINQMEGVDIVADLNKPLDELPDNCVIDITSYHVFEHISNLLGLMAELHRITKHDGQIEIIVPHFSYPPAYSDPTHVRFFGLYTMCYFSEEQFTHRVPTYYTPVKFRILSIEIRFKRIGIDRLFAPLKEKLVNLNKRYQETYERFFCWICPALEIRYVIQPCK